MEGGYSTEDFLIFLGMLLARDHFGCDDNLDTSHRYSNNFLWNRRPFLFVIPRGCDFFDFSCFWYTPADVFQNSHKTVILSEAPRESIA
jgi:hypothetical protein